MERKHQSNKVPKSKIELFLRAYQHKVRQRIIEFLEDKKKSDVTNIYVKLRLEQSVASQHLAILLEAGLVAWDPNGKFHEYVVVPEKVAEVRKLVED